MKIVIRRITPRDNERIAHIIRSVMPDFGAGGFGFAIHDAEVEDMFTAYQQPRSAYFVIEVNGKVAGGAGIARLQGVDQDTCELKKMYFLPAERKKGFGQLALKTCLRTAREFGYTRCYLETFHTMKEAIRLYEQNGFERIPGPLGNTGHFACDTFYLRDLDDQALHSN